MKAGRSQEVAALRAALGADADATYARGAKAYLKSDLAFLGARTPRVRSVAKTWTKAQRDLTRAQLVDVAQALWDEPVFELKLLASILLQLRVDLLAPRDLPWLRGLVRDSATWALVDQLAPQVVGPILARDAALRERTLRAWSRDASFWVRRAALLAQLLDFRRGEGDWPLWCELADGMLDDREFFLRKAIGWVLREAAQREPDKVVDFLTPRMARASGLTVREATRKLPSAHRRALGLAPAARSL